MKKINFDIVFKILVLIQLTLILVFTLLNDSPKYSQQLVEPNENGRYKEIKTKRFNIRGEEIDEQVRILDTQTGEYVEH
jgi:hypothetical protein